MKLYFYLLQLFQLLNIRVVGQNVINTDRPDQSDGTHILEKDHFQIESGAEFSQIDEATKGFDNVTLLRYGISRKFEVRFLNQYSKITDSNSVSGIRSPTISFKNQLCNQKGLLPKLTLVSYLRLPVTFNSNFPGNHLGYTFTLAARHDLNDKIKIYSNLGISRDQQSKDISYLATLEANYNITSAFSSFIEYFGNYAQHTSPSNGMDIGFIYALRSNFALDTSLGSSLFDLSKNKFVSFGMSLRFATNSNHQKNNS